MILYTLKNKSYHNKNNISLDWQKKSIFKINVKPIT